LLPGDAPERNYVTHHPGFAFFLINPAPNYQQSVTPKNAGTTYYFCQAEFVARSANILSSSTILSTEKKCKTGMLKFNEFAQRNLSHVPQYFS
jgi:hypothetical protein